MTESLKIANDKQNAGTCGTETYSRRLVVVAAGRGAWRGQRIHSRHAVINMAKHMLTMNDVPDLIGMLYARRLLDEVSNVVNQQIELSAKYFDNYLGCEWRCNSTLIHWHSRSAEKSRNKLLTWIIYWGDRKLNNFTFYELHNEPKTSNEAIEFRRMRRKRLAQIKSDKKKQQQQEMESREKSKANELARHLRIRESIREDLIRDLKNQRRLFLRGKLLLALFEKFAKAFVDLGKWDYAKMQRECSDAFVMFNGLHSHCPICMRNFEDRVEVEFNVIIEGEESSTRRSTVVVIASIKDLIVIPRREGIESALLNLPEVRSSFIRSSITKYIELRQRIRNLNNSHERK